MIEVIQLVFNLKEFLYKDVNLKFKGNCYGILERMSGEITFLFLQNN